MFNFFDPHRRRLKSSKSIKLEVDRIKKSLVKLKKFYKNHPYVKSSTSDQEAVFSGWLPDERAAFRLDLKKRKTKSKKLRSDEEAEQYLLAKRKAFKKNALKKEKSDKEKQNIGKKSNIFNLGKKRLKAIRNRNLRKIRRLTPDEIVSELDAIEQQINGLSNRLGALILERNRTLDKKRKRLLAEQIKHTKIKMNFYLKKQSKFIRLSNH